MTNRRTATVLIILSALIIVCLPLGLLLGSVAISRARLSMPCAVTAMRCLVSS